MSESQYLVKKSLSDIKPGDFLASTGMKGTDGKIHAIEVRIFPKATPDGGRQFPWDLGADSVMTNATVGTVDQTPNGPLVHVKFTGGESEYTIGPDVPILASARRRHEPAEARRRGVRDRAEAAGRQDDERPRLRREGRRQAADVGTGLSLRRARQAGKLGGPSRLPAARDCLAPLATTGSST